MENKALTFNPYFPFFHFSIIPISHHTLFVTLSGGGRAELGQAEGSYCQSYNPEYTFKTVNLPDFLISCSTLIYFRLES
jgi:hypothetical protein